MRRTVLLILLLVTSVAVAPSTASAKPAPKPKPIMVVLGDSISALDNRPRVDGGYLYNDTAKHRMQAWWSILRKQKGYRVREYANAGSGWSKRAKSCRLPSFQEQAVDPKVVKDIARAKVVVVAGGVNDQNFCDKTITDITAGADATLAAIRAANPKVRIITTAPWGPRSANQSYRAANIRAIKAASTKHGATYVATALNKQRTFDSIHPNRAGAEMMARKIGAHVR